MLSMLFLADLISSFDFHEQNNIFQYQTLTFSRWKNRKAAEDEENCVAQTRYHITSLYVTFMELIEMLIEKSKKKKIFFRFLKVKLIDWTQSR